MIICQVLLHKFPSFIYNILMLVPITIVVLLTIAILHTHNFVHIFRHRRKFWGGMVQKNIRQSLCHHSPLQCKGKNWHNQETNTPQGLQNAGTNNKTSKSYTSKARPPNLKANKHTSEHIHRPTNCRRMQSC